VQRKLSVFEEARERHARIARVPDSLRQRRVVEDVVGVTIAPRKEGVDDGLGLFLPSCEADLARGVNLAALDPEELADQRQRLARSLRLAGQRLEKVAPAVSPAAHLDHRAVRVQVVVHGVRRPPDSPGSLRA
jgi:hypothetical protein